MGRVLSRLPSSDSPRGRRRVLLLNHFAVPLHAPGGTRHAELVSHLANWEGTIVAGNRNLLTRARTDFDRAFRAVWVSPYSDNGPARVLNWLSFVVTSLVAGVRLPRPDVVYASSPHLFAGVSGWLLARIRRSAFVLEVRDLWPDVLVDMGTLRGDSIVLRVLRSLESFLYRRAERIVVLTPGVGTRLAERGIWPAKIVVIPNGADPADFASPAPRSDVRARFGFDGFTVLYAGAHGPANALDLVLDAAAKVATVRSDVRFVLVGDGVQKPALVARASREGIDNVRFLEPVAKNDMPALLHAADVGLHVLADVPLFHFGVSPNKLYDYLAAGLPVVTNTPGEVAAIVRDADAGVAVAPTAIDEGVLCIVGASDERRRAWSEHGRAWMAANRSRRALAAKLETMLDELVGG